MNTNIPIDGGGETMLSDEEIVTRAEKLARCYDEDNRDVVFNFMMACLIREWVEDKTGAVVFLCHMEDAKPSIETLADVWAETGNSALLSARCLMADTTETTCVSCGEHYPVPSEEYSFLSTLLRGVLEGSEPLNTLCRGCGKCDNCHDDDVESLKARHERMSEIYDRLQPLIDGIKW